MVLNEAVDLPSFKDGKQVHWVFGNIPDNKTFRSPLAYLIIKI